MFAAIALTVGLSLPGPGQTPEAETNVALGKRYSCSSPGGIAWQGLLDGVTDSDSEPGCFATGNDAVFPKKLVIDLGAVYLIDQVRVYNSANGNTKKVDVWASRDGLGYTQVREPYVFPNGVAQWMSAKFPPLEARFVKLALWDTYGGGLGGDNILYLREVEVLGRPVTTVSAARARPETAATPPRSVRLCQRYALQPGNSVKLLAIGDDLAAAQNGAPGLAAVVAEQLRERFSLGEVRVTDQALPGRTAAAAVAAGLPAESPPDIVLVSLGVADSLHYDASVFRGSLARLFSLCLENTPALVIVVLPPRIPHSAELDRAAECASADTTDAAWQEATLAAGTEIAVVDAEAALKKTGVPVTSAFADNLSLGDVGRKAVAAAIVALFP